MGMKQAAGTYHYAPSRRRWGQNFLRDRGVADRILSAIAPGPGDLFLEIGPGEGALTEGLAAAAEAVAAVEIDPLMASILREGLAKRHRNLVVLQADALELGPEEILQHLGRDPGDGSRLRLAGNLPFNSSVPLVRRWIERLPLVWDMTFMVQLEVAERMLARPSTSAYGYLSLAVQLSCSVTQVLFVGRGAFKPMPNVDAAVVRLEPLAEPAVPERDRRWVLEVVSMAFRSRRKTLYNNLRADRRFAGSTDLLAEAFQRTGLARERRGESLALEEFAVLARELSTVPGAAGTD